MERTDRQFFKHFDLWLFGATVLLSVIGILMIYSATACIDAQPLDWQSTAIKQLLYLTGGVASMFILTFVDYRLYAALRWPIWIVTVGLLGIVSAIGVITHGAQRWVDLPFFRFQPSELSKLLLVLVVAKFMSDHEEQMSQWRYLAASFAFVALPIALVYLQPDLGTSIILALTWGVMALAAGMRPRDVMIAAAVLLVAAYPIFTTLQPYQQERIQTFLNPEMDPLGSGYNVTQARIAIGSGGAQGLGFCSGTQSQLRFLRIRSTDFIFSVIGEELGFFGALFVMGLIAFILLRMIRVAGVARTTYGKLVVVGLVAVIFMQSFVNLGMNVGLMPVTGIPLPFVSAGGSSLITLLMGEGVVQSILIRHQRFDLTGASRRY
ncbi:MAG: rod shape-determining protein RodA [Chloroflexi bacterium]|nr:rod shape-determining protein RodA [Chloroflexota bacterium]MCL5950445.1 rod shape-determining protein RodA [Chloroflexota bacterium]